MQTCMPIEHCFKREFTMCSKVSIQTKVSTDLEPDYRLSFHTLLTHSCTEIKVNPLLHQTDFMSRLHNSVKMGLIPYQYSIGELLSPFEDLYLKLRNKRTRKEGFSVNGKMDAKIY